MLTIQPLTEADWETIALEHPGWAQMTRQVLLEHHTEAWSGYEGDKLLGAVGFIFHYAQQAYCWGAFLTARWPRVPRQVLQAIRAKRDEIVQRRGLIRIEARADCAHIAGARFLEALGFRCEGMTQCSNQYGESQFLYAYVTHAALQYQQTVQTQRYGALAMDIQHARVRHVTQSLERTCLWSSPS